MGRGGNGSQRCPAQRLARSGRPIHESRDRRIHPDRRPGSGHGLLQKDPLNVWRAEELNASGAPLLVHWVDWGDNLESVDWHTRSQVRTEVVLYQENRSGSPWLEYSRRHVAGWGIDEVHGLAAEVGEEPTGAAWTVLVPADNLSYVDVRILERGGSGGRRSR